MRTKPLLVAFVTAAAAILGASPSRADGMGALLSDPELRSDPRVQRLAELDRRMDRLLERYGALEREVGRAALAYLDATRAARAAETTVVEAENDLDQRIRATYELGPGATVEALLGAETFADLALISEYLGRATSAHVRMVHEVSLAQVVAISLRARAEAELAAVTPRLRSLQALLAELQAALDHALALAQEAKVEHEWLEERRRTLAEAAARQEGWEDLRTLTWGEDQSPFLALLGPSGGRSCETPAGLMATGERFSGWATWYGWEFGGQSTAMGATFDPRLFTAANRWLPMGSFLRVRNGDRCAIVLVNDRGPYGNLERVIDLSQAAGHYLGVGVSWVHAEVLVVAPPA
jgi:hypothetical protein